MLRRIGWWSTLWAAVLLGLHPLTAAGASSPMLSFQPDLAVARPGETARLEIWVEGVSGLDRLEFVASYDPGALEPVDADPGRDGVQLEIGPVFEGGYSPANSAADGVLHLVIQRFPGDGPFDGTGMVAAITFRVREGALPAVYPVSFDPGSLQLLDPDGEPLPLGGWADGAVRVPPVTIALAGWITREGTSNYARTSVTAFFYPYAGSLPSAWARACTDSSGNFYLPVPEEPVPPPPELPLPDGGPPSGPYEWAYVRLDFPNHGSECYWIPLDEEVVDIGWHTLEGGDVNADGCVNIYDIVRIIADFGEEGASPCFVPYTPCPATGVGEAAPSSDINGDCRVNIFDLTIAAENFGLCTNCP